jgi:hypothetical protein
MKSHVTNMQTLTKYYTIYHSQFKQNGIFVVNHE